MRRSQGYSLGMVYATSRLLEVALVESLQKNLSAPDYGRLLPDVMTIVGAVDSQLAPAMDRHTEVVQNQMAEQLPESREAETTARKHERAVGYLSLYL